MTTYVIHVCIGNDADPTTSWCRWGGSGDEWYRLDLQVLDRAGPYRFRRRHRRTTAEEREGLRSDGWTWDGAAWCLPRSRA